MQPHSGSFTNSRKNCNYVQLQLIRAVPGGEYALSTRIEREKSE
ncbi:hypothetical protein M2171_005560 [Bradyrhizobium japonicum USDA 38]|nr:hypothetical protein [Bradyrhizobium japonicum USDA 38]MCS3948941.1 hypothetical protein [Bradyrhizobium japonicum]